MHLSCSKYAGWIWLVPWCAEFFVSAFRDVSRPGFEFPTNSIHYNQRWWSDGRKSIKQPSGIFTILSTHLCHCHSSSHEPFQKFSSCAYAPSFPSCSAWSCTFASDTATCVSLSDSTLRLKADISILDHLRVWWSTTSFNALWFLELSLKYCSRKSKDVSASSETGQPYFR